MGIGTNIIERKTTPAPQWAEELLRKYLGRRSGWRFKWREPVKAECVKRSNWGYCSLDGSQTIWIFSTKEATPAARALVLHEICHARRGLPRKRQRVGKFKPIKGVVYSPGWEAHVNKMRRKKKGRRVLHDGRFWKMVVGMYEAEGILDFVADSCFGYKAEWRAARARQQQLAERAAAKLRTAIDEPQRVAASGPAAKLARVHAATIAGEPVSVGELWIDYSGLQPLPGGDGWI